MSEAQDSPGGSSEPGGPSPTAKPATPDRSVRRLWIITAISAAIAVAAIGAVAALLISRPQREPGPTSAQGLATSSSAPAEAVGSARTTACERLTTSFKESEQAPEQWRTALADNSTFVMDQATDGVFAAQLRSLLAAYRAADAIDRNVDETAYENASLTVFGDFKAVADTCKSVGVVFTAGGSQSSDDRTADSAAATTATVNGNAPVIVTGSSLPPGVSATTYGLPPTAVESTSPAISPANTGPPAGTGGAASPSDPSIIDCSGQVILVMNKTGLAGAIAQDPSGTLAAYPSGAKLGTFAADCVSPGQTVIYYGPFKTQGEAWEKRRALRTGQADVLLVAVDESANEPGGICQLAQTESPPVLSTDPTAGISTGPWVFELTNVLIAKSLLPSSESDQSDLSSAFVQAVKQYQTELGVFPDGEVGPKSWAKILADNCAE